MITLTSDQHALVKVGFSIRDSVHQGPGWSTPHHEVHPRGFAPHEKAIRNNVSLCGAMDETTLVRRLCT
jgi:hypothetical protein